jgi:V8-like Glu-specific endopeptidase
MRRNGLVPPSPTLVVVGLLVAAPAPTQDPRFTVDREDSKSYDMVVEELARARPLERLAPGAPLSATVYHDSTVRALRVHVRLDPAVPAAPGWRLQFRTLDGDVVEEVAGDSPLVRAEGYWSDTIPGRGSIVDLVGTVGPDPHLAVDAYAYSEGRSVPSAIHGPDGRQAIRKALPDLQAHAGPIGRLRTMTRRGEAFCSGFLVSASLLMTNHHCVADEAEARSTVVELGYDSYTSSPTRHRVAAVEATDAGLDFAVLRLTPAPEARWGRLTLASTGEVTDREPLAIIQHPGGEPKQVSVDGCVVSGVARTGSGGALSDFGHECDTLGGSSGSPVLDPATGQVVGLHHLGFDEDDRDPVNQAVRIGLIVESLRASKPLLHGEIMN